MQPNLNSWGINHVEECPSTGTIHMDVSVMVVFNVCYPCPYISLIASRYSDQQILDACRCADPGGPHHPRVRVGFDHPDPHLN